MKSIHKAFLRKEMLPFLYRKSHENLLALELTHYKVGAGGMKTLSGFGMDKVVEFWIP